MRHCALLLGIVLIGCSPASQRTSVPTEDQESSTPVVEDSSADRGDPTSKADGSPAATVASNAATAQSESAATGDEGPVGRPDTKKASDTTKPKVFVIDVRSKEEWDTGHVEQAFHIPHTEIGERIGEVTDDKDAKIVVYCRVGGRAGRAKATLEELGFENVENAGGFNDVKDRFK